MKSRTKRGKILCKASHVRQHKKVKVVSLECRMHCNRLYCIALPCIVADAVAVALCCLRVCGRDFRHSITRSTLLTMHRCNWHFFPSKHTRIFESFPSISKKKANSKVMLLCIKITKCHFESFLHAIGTIQV